METVCGRLLSRIRYIFRLVARTRLCTVVAMMKLLLTGVSAGTQCQGFIQRGGGPGISPPEILKLSMVFILAIYMLLDISMYHQNV